MLAVATQPRNRRILLPAQHRGQRKAFDEMRRFNIWCMGRRWGKNILAQDLTVRTALNRGIVGWFAPSYKMLSDDWRAVKSALATIVTKTSEQERRFELITGGVVEMLSLDNPDSGRGKSFDLVIINEAAMIKDLEYIWSATVRPTLADRRGRAVLPSTPKGLNGFYQLWRQAGEDPEWSRYHAPTSENPFIEPGEIDVLRRSLPDRVFRQEILAEFIEDGAYFRKVDAVCVIEDPSTPEEHKGHALVAGLDWAMSEDYTVLTILCGTCGEVVDWYRLNSLDYIYQRAVVVEAVNRWGARVLPERNSIGQPNIELLQERVPVMYGPDDKPGFYTTASTKAELIRKLASGMELGELLAPVDYADELRMFQIETGGALPKFGAPAGIHDDRVISLALAWWAATSGAGWLMA